MPIEEAWNILNESQKGLSGIECHARISITHYKGKTEVAAITNEPIPGLPGSENGVVTIKLLRRNLMHRIEEKSASSDAIRMQCGLTTTKIASLR